MIFTQFLWCSDLHSKDTYTDVEVYKTHALQVLTLIPKNKLYANLKKCIFAAGKIPLLGCTVDRHGMRLALEKIKEISDWPVPLDVKEL